jgi:hypothetical protein
MTIESTTEVLARWAAEFQLDDAPGEVLPNSAAAAMRAKGFE